MLVGTQGNEDKLKHQEYNVTDIVWTVFTVFDYVLTGKNDR